MKVGECQYLGVDVAFRPRLNSQMSLYEQLADWFRVSSTNPKRWHRDPVGILIKEQLKLTKNWKYAPRGNPRKGYDMQQEKLNGHNE